MKKNKGFTLLELLVAMAFLSIVIVMSSILFDRAIQNTPQMQQNLERTSDGTSKMEKAILDVKEAYIYHETNPKDINKKPENYDKITGTVTTGTDYTGAPITLDIDGSFIINPPKGQSINISKVKGYLLSVSNTSTNEVKYNSVSTDDRMFTFVSTGHIPSPAATIEDLYWDESSRFSYLSMKEHSGKLDLDVVYTIAALNKDKLQKSRLRFLKSPVDKGGYIYSLYNDEEYVFPFTLTSDVLAYIDVEKDSEDENGAKETYHINDYSSNQQEFLDAIDRVYGATAVTFNLSGHIGSTITTFGNSNKTKQNMLYFIGLPYSNALSAHYDSNLIVSRDTTETQKYYSLFDLKNKDKTAYGDLIKDLGNEYSFSWAGKDIRDLIGIGNKSGSISMPDAFLKKITIKDTSVVDRAIPNITKSYGNTLYYRMWDSNNSIKFNPNSDFTFFVKYNAMNYAENFNDSKERYPYTLLSYNYDYNTGELSSSSIKKGFLIFVDKNGDVKKVELELGKNPVYSDLSFNIKNSMLYTDSQNFKFDRLNYSGKDNTKRDEREGFNIIGVTKMGTSLEISILGRDTNENNQIKTFTTKFNLNLDDVSGEFTFGTLVKAIKNSAGQIESLVSSADKEQVMEVSDVVMYSQAFFSTEVNMTMDYLYRKYLTEKERKEGNFDKNFINKY